MVEYTQSVISDLRATQGNPYDVSTQIFSNQVGLELGVSAQITDETKAAYLKTTRGYSGTEAQDATAIVRWLDRNDPFIRSVITDDLTTPAHGGPTAGLSATDVEARINELLALSSGVDKDGNFIRIDDNGNIVTLARNAEGAIVPSGSPGAVDVTTANSPTEIPLGLLSENQVRAIDDLIASLRAAGVVSSINATTSAIRNIATDGYFVQRVDSYTIATATGTDLENALARWNDLPGVPEIVKRLVQVGADARTDSFVEVNGDRQIDLENLENVTLQHMIRFEYIQRGNEIQFEQLGELRRYLGVTDSTLAVMNKFQDVLVGKEAEEAKLDLAALQAIGDLKNAGLRRTEDIGSSYWVDFDATQLGRETTLNDPLLTGNEEFVPFNASGVNSHSAIDKYTGGVRLGYTVKLSEAQNGGYKISLAEATFYNGVLGVRTNTPGGSDFTDYLRNTTNRVREDQSLDNNVDNNATVFVQGNEGQLTGVQSGFPTGNEAGVEDGFGGGNRVREQEVWDQIREGVSDNTRSPEAFAALVEQWEASQFENRELQPRTNATTIGFDHTAGFTRPDLNDPSINVATNVDPNSVIGRWLNAFAEEGGQDVYVITSGPDIGKVSDVPTGVTMRQLYEGSTFVIANPNAPPATIVNEAALGSAMLNTVTSRLEQQRDELTEVITFATQEAGLAPELLRSLDNMRTKLIDTINSLNGQTPGATIFDVIKDIGQSGVDEGQFQQDVDRAFVAINASNDSFKEELRRRMFEFEEFYKSASAVMAKITQILEKIAQNIAR